MTKKILITTETLEMGGVETTLLSLLKFLKSYDVEIDLYVLKKGVLSEEFQKLNNIQIIPAKISQNKIIYRIMKTFLCNSLHKKYQHQNPKKYDISIAFYGINNYCDMYAAACNAKKKYIWVHCNLETLSKTSKYKKIMAIRNKIMSKKFKYFNNIISVSESAKKGFLNLFKNYQDKIIVINNLIDLKRLEKRYEPCEYKLEGNNKLIFVGRLVKVKRVELLIKEFKKVLPILPDTYLYIVGDGPERANLEKIVNNYNLQAKIIFLGNQKNPFPYIEQADAVVATSKSESYSISIVEALAMNKYFISTNNEGVEEVFYIANKANLKNGIICKPEFLHLHIINYLNNKNKIKPEFNIKEYNQNIEKQLIEILDLEK